MNLKNKTIIITGASRGIGRAIALRCAKEGANLVLAAKSVEEGKLPGTIFSVAKEVEALGAQALPIKVDVRNPEEIENMVKEAHAKFGEINALINNAGAIQLTPLSETPPKRMDLMLDINVRAVLLCSHYCMPYLKEAGGGHIINLSPPISLDKKWIAEKTPYTISKYGMSLATLGLSEELKEAKIAVNSLWPRTMIATAAVNMLMGAEGLKHSRTPEIMADAAFEILNSDETLSGNLLIDETFLKEKGYTDFKKYQNDPEAETMLDLYVED
jgi:citronellol/citronellal dehydrogenase